MVSVLDSGILQGESDKVVKVSWLCCLLLLWEEIWRIGSTVRFQQRRMRKADLWSASAVNTLFELPKVRLDLKICEESWSRCTSYISNWKYDMQVFGFNFGWLILVGNCWPPSWLVFSPLGLFKNSPSSQIWSRQNQGSIWLFSSWHCVHNSQQNFRNCFGQKNQNATWSSTPSRRVRETVTFVCCLCIFFNRSKLLKFLTLRQNIYL